MKILFLLQEFPYPPENGFCWKVFSLLKEISRKHECHLLSFADSLPESSLQQFLDVCPMVKVLGVFLPRKATFRAQLRGLFEVGLPSAGVYSVPEFREAVRHALATTSYNVLHIDMINLVQYASLASHSAIILSVNDAVSLGYWNAVSESPSLAGRVRRKVASKIIASYEGRAYRGRVVHVVSEVDREYLRNFCSSARIEVVPLAVDPTYFLRYPSENHLDPKTVTIPANFRVADVCSSVLRFLEAITCLAKSEKLNVVFKLVGPGATPAFIRSVSGLEGVQYLGWVDDYVGTLASSDLVVVPDRLGGGG